MRIPDVIADRRKRSREAEAAYDRASADFQVAHRAADEAADDYREALKAEVVALCTDISAARVGPFTVILEAVDSIPDIQTAVEVLRSYRADLDSREAARPLNRLRHLFSSHVGGYTGAKTTELLGGLPSELSPAFRDPIATAQLRRAPEWAGQEVSVRISGPIA